jgi:hypothetical protein
MMALPLQASNQKLARSPLENVDSTMILPWLV